MLDDRNSEQLYRIGLFAQKLIPKWTELSYNYGYVPGTIPGLHIPCKCGADTCSGRLL